MKHLKRLALLGMSLIFLAAANAQSKPEQTKPDVVLNGPIDGAQNKTYFEIPFQVPANTHRLSVDFSYTGREERTTLDLGIADSFRFRGNSGGNKKHFTIGENDATPSYLPGAIPPGQWKLLISVPNIRPTEHAAYHAEVRFNSAEEDSSFTLAPLATGRHWYRGDLHMHTAHSDGSCLSQSGQKVPCPLFLTVETAAARNLDFIAITDHNATSQYDDERELQPYFDKVLLIPGREMTTFWGHFNIFGVTQFVDYRESPQTGLDLNTILRDVRAKGGIASINHADAPSGEDCMGCGWQQPPDSSPAIDMSLFTGVEVINGGRIFLSSADFWDRQLAKGTQLTAIGGSDNHSAPGVGGRISTIGFPLTVVEADELSVSAILDGIRRGRVFIDLTSSHDRIVDISAHDLSTHQTTGASSEAVRMGGTLDAAAGDTIAFAVQIAACPISHIHLFLDGSETPALPPLVTKAGNETLPFEWKTDGRAHWLRAEVRDSNGSLVLVSNPIYIHTAH